MKKAVEFFGSRIANWICQCTRREFEARQVRTSEGRKRKFFLNCENPIFDLSILLEVLGIYRGILYHCWDADCVCDVLAKCSPWKESRKMTSNNWCVGYQFIKVMPRDHLVSKAKCKSGNFIVKRGTMLTFSKPWEQYLSIYPVMSILPLSQNQISIITSREQWTKTFYVHQKYVSKLHQFFVVLANE